ncbi:hypothetical protein [Macrococcoides caseolyticum]|uniref:Uncharacterized protein n=1 Tax=Macrococcoides caseolyticum TaxID=69966 RepID=A0A855H351_9STAP|nr:hypothetical protein [Macrococcus caseolyticus]PKE26147.1 hypothetical protein CW686_06465 [Macrococcus caseolyticus]PKE58661.1 hypothetical protein CW673_06585 [Macrococcus caseolyticus]
MIKVGDKVTFDGDDYVIHNMEESGVTLYKDGNPLRPNFMGNVVFYSELAREQKQRADELEKSLNLSILASNNDALVTELQMALSESNERADELEKRWKKLKEHFVKEKEKSFGILSWSRNNAVLELIERLQEDDND